MSGGLSAALREARKSSGLPFAIFAKRARFSESHLRSVENGNRPVTLAVVRAYDRVLVTGGRFAAAFALSSPAAESDGNHAMAWDQRGTLEMMTGLLSGGEVNRRAFIAASGSALTVLAARWRSALGGSGPLGACGSRQVSSALVTHVEDRLDHLRHLDDELGSGDLAGLAKSELALIVRLLRVGRYSDETGGRLYGLAAEACRQAAWDFFDQDNQAAARQYFETALRASATADDPVTGGYVLSFAAVQCYSTGQPQQAVSLLETALTAAGRGATPRMKAMLAARSARAVSKTGSQPGCAHFLHLARAALDHGPHPDDPPFLYWVSQGEIEMIAGSSALDLGDPAQAIRCFDAAMAADYRGDDQYPRSHAIYLARAAEAHLVLHDLDAATEKAAHAVRCLGGVDSARSSSAIAGLRAKLRPHADSRAVREFLGQTEQIVESKRLSLWKFQQLPQRGGGRLLVQGVDHGHAHAIGGHQVFFRVVEEHARLGRQAELVEGQPENPWIGLADTMLIGQHYDIEVADQVVRCIRIMGRAAQAVGQHGRLYAIGARLAGHLQDVVGRPQIVQDAPHEVVARNPQECAEPFVPLCLADLPEFQPTVEILALRCRPHPQVQAPGQSLADLELLDNLHHIAGQHAGEVEDHARKPSHAR